MKLSPTLQKAYTTEQQSAHQAQALAEMIAWGPAMFQAARLLLKFGILDMLRDSADGLTRQDIIERATLCDGAALSQAGKPAPLCLSDYAAKCLLEAGLTMGVLLIDTDTDRYRLSKAGWFLVIDPATRANIDFNHDVNYEGFYHLEEALLEGRPAGLEHFGPWPTVYEGLSQLPRKAQQSWFAFDHFYSDHSFPEALDIVFCQHHTRSLYDVGGNTGRWALQCVAFDSEVKVTILDLPGQIGMMQRATAGQPGAERIKGYGINLLDATAAFPLLSDVCAEAEDESADVSVTDGPDAIWMSQFLDCFSMDEIVSILSRAKAVMSADTRLYIMETLWDRQRYQPAAFSLAMTSLYFTAIANGNSKMYNTEDLEACIRRAGLVVETIHDGLGHGHSIVVCRTAEA